MTSVFEDLIAYQRALALADAVQRAIAEWPSFEKWTLGKQMVRAADSIGANIAEGAGRATPRDRRHMFVVARGSLYETEHWMKTARRRGLKAPDEPTDEIGRLINGLINRQA